MSEPTEEAFLTSLRARPDDDATRIVYADWLEEQQRFMESNFLRFDFACPKQWESLAPTDEGDNVRFCGACKSNVYYSATVDEAYAHARKGRCVVVDLVPVRWKGDLDPRLPPPRMGGVMMPLMLPPTVKPPRSPT